MGTLGGGRAASDGLADSVAHDEGADEFAGVKSLGCLGAEGLQVDGRFYSQPSGRPDGGRVGAFPSTGAYVPQAPNGHAARGLARSKGATWPRSPDGVRRSAGCDRGRFLADLGAPRRELPGADQRDDHQQAGHVEDRREAESGGHAVREHVLCLSGRG
jgi:hypothetical protein